MTDAGRTSKLKRVMSTVSRELDFFTKAGLQAQTGKPVQEWYPELFVKELTDNALDAAEARGRDPVIAVMLADSLQVTDNGGGLSAPDFKRILEYSTVTSDKANYVSPSRGQMGNAMKCLLAAPFVLARSEGQETASPVEVISRGWKHRVSFRVRDLKGVPELVYDKAPIVHFDGLSVCFPGLSASGRPFSEVLQNVQKLLRQYALFNPHAAFSGNVLCCEATRPGWRKWRLDEPTSAHWYDQGTFEDLLRSYVLQERSQGKKGTVANFIREAIRGMARSEKQQAAMQRAGLPKGTLLEQLVPEDSFDHAAMARLLAALQAEAAPVKPDALGRIGKEHFERRFAGGHFRYQPRQGMAGRLPFLVEAAFAIVGRDSPMQGFHAGLNWSVPLGQAFGKNPYATAGGFTEKMLNVLARAHINLYDPVALAVHIACPHFEFLDKAKSRVDLPLEIFDAMEDAIQKAAGEWIRLHKARDRENERRAVRQEKLERKAAIEADRQLRAEARADAAAAKAAELPKPKRVTDKEIVFKWLPAAYAHASGNGADWTSANNVYYAKRLEIRAEIGHPPKKEQSWRQRFCYELLREYRQLHPEARDWKIYYDPRGKLIEPHTNREVDLGTRQVDDYLLAPGAGRCYGGILYCEKSTHVGLIRKWGIDRQYDLALAHSVGVGTESVRVLIDGLASKARIFALHDFDKAGFVAVAILRKDNRTHRHDVVPEVVDLGLRLEDVEGRQAEEVDFGRSDPRANLKVNGATEEEIAFLCTGQDGRGHYVGRRVELNTFTAPEYKRWLRKKLDAAGAEKLIPDDQVINPLYLEARQEHLDSLQFQRQAKLNELTERRQAKLDLAVAEKRKAAREKIDAEVWRAFREEHGDEMARLCRRVDRLDKKAQRRIKPAKQLKARLLKPRKAMVPPDLRERIRKDLQKHRTDLWTAAVSRVEAAEPVKRQRSGRA
jgi:hypothetical protein